MSIFRLTALIALSVVSTQTRAQTIQPFTLSPSQSGMDVRVEGVDESTPTQKQKQRNGSLADPNALSYGEGTKVTGPDRLWESGEP